MKWAVLLLAAALTHPRPVTTLGAVRNSDGTVTLNWGLPADPTVVGITIFRDRLDAWDELTIELVGLASSHTDSGARFGRSYRYWVYTRDAEGELSDGAFVEVIDGDDFDDHDWECHAEGSVGANPAVPLAAAAASLVLAALLRRGRRAGSA